MLQFLHSLNHDFEKKISDLELELEIKKPNEKIQPHFWTRVSKSKQWSSDGIVRIENLVPKKPTQFLRFNNKRSIIWVWMGEERSEESLILY